jgi:hypothetical protein
MCINILQYTDLVSEKLIQIHIFILLVFSLCFNLLLSVLHSQTLDSVNLLVFHLDDNIEPMRDEQVSIG